jgi:HEAT repeat protein
MGQALTLPAKAFRTVVARLGIPLLLLFASPAPEQGQQRPSATELLDQFESSTYFWKQFEVAKAIVAAKDTSVLPQLESLLTHVDRHLRGNAAFILAGLGDPRGFDVIVAILADRSERRAVNEISPVGGGWVQGQIREDRYYAAHLLGDLKDVRAIPILVPFLKDTDVNHIVPWSLAQIGDRSAIRPLIGTLGDMDPSMRVLAIHALEDLKAAEALPKLRELLADDQRCNFDKLESVAHAAQSAIAKLSSEK